MKVIVNLLLILWVVSATPAYAYLDPGTGSMLLQALLGAIAAAITVISLYYHKVKAFFSRLLKSNEKSKNAPKK